MEPALKGNMLIAQSGGPTVVINRSLVAAIEEAKGHRAIRGIYGAVFGIQGILSESFVDLRKESRKTLETVAATPCSALGSVRKRPSVEECGRMFSVLKRYDIRYFFYIGGNDTAETALSLSKNAAASGFEFRCIHIPKTIDNDLMKNDHTPGYASAARFVACAMMGDDQDNRSLPGVKVDVIMGRDAGFLTAASSLARQRPGDGPHLLYVPEKPFSMEEFLADVQRVYTKHGRCLAAVSEGIREKDGERVVVKYQKMMGKAVGQDSFEHDQLSGTGFLGDLLAGRIKANLNIQRVRADTFGYLQRSFPGVVSDVDAVEAEEVGRRAVRFAMSAGRDGSVVIRREEGRRYRVSYGLVDLKEVAGRTRFLEGRFIHRSRADVTNAFLEYAGPLVGTLPTMGMLKGVPVRRAAGG